MYSISEFPSTQSYPGVNSITRGYSTNHRTAGGNATSVSSFFGGRGWILLCTKNAQTLDVKKKSKVKIIIMHLYGCFQKWWYPQIIHFNRVFHDKPSILGYHYFRKHPCTSINYIPNYDLGTIGVRFFITCFKRETSGVLWKSFQRCGIGVYVRFANVDVDEDGI